MSDSLQQNSLCLICGQKGIHSIYLTSGQSIVSATGTQLGNFLYKIISEEPCYSISEVICEQCYLLLDRLDTYQARAAEINSHISERYKDTKLSLIGCRKRISDLIANSLSDIKSFKNGTTLNVSDELSVTIFHEALPRLVNKSICNGIAVSSSQKDAPRPSHLKQYNSDLFRYRAKKQLYMHNLIRSKQLYRNSIQKYKAGNRTGLLNKNIIGHGRTVANVKRKLPSSYKENSAPKKAKIKHIIEERVLSGISAISHKESHSSSSTIPLNNVSSVNRSFPSLSNKKVSEENFASSENSEDVHIISSSVNEALPNKKIENISNNSSSFELGLSNNKNYDVNYSQKSPSVIRGNYEQVESARKTEPEENSDCEKDENENSTTSSTNSSSSSSNESSSSDSSSNVSSSSSEDNSSDDEDQYPDLIDDSQKCNVLNLDSQENDQSNQNQLKNIDLKNEMKNDSEQSVIKIEVDDAPVTQSVTKQIKVEGKNNTSPHRQSNVKAPKTSKNISAPADSIDPQFAQAVLMQNSLASSLFQSFLSTSLWMSSPGSPNKKNSNAQNQNKLEECQMENADDTLSGSVGSINDKQKRIELKNTGQSYINTKGKLVEAKRVSPQDCSRCPLRCNGRLSDEKRQAIFADYWGLADYNLQREYLASHMDREERMGPSGIVRNVILYYLTYKESKVQVCRQFFLKTLDISEKASRLVIEKRLKS